MHSATIITLLSASLVVASPMHQLFHKKAIVTDIVTDIVTVTVTGDGAAPAEPTTAPKKEAIHTHHSSVEVPATTSAAAPPPPPAPTTSSVAVVTISFSAPAPPVQTPTPSSAAPSSAAAAPSASPTDYASTAVFNHNQHRTNHSASVVAWNQTLADWAAITAKTCVFAHDM